MFGRLILSACHLARPDVSLADPQTDRRTDRQKTGRQTNRQTDRPTQGRVCIVATFPSDKSIKLSEPQTVNERKRDRETERQRDRQTDGRRDRKADRQTTDGRERERERESEDNRHLLLIRTPPKRNIREYKGK